LPKARWRYGFSCQCCRREGTTQLCTGDGRRQREIATLKLDLCPSYALYKLVASNMGDTTERIQIASSFLLQAPPGEINDVLNGMFHQHMIVNSLCQTFTSSTLDVRNIIADDDALQTGVLPALREYNLSQFIIADLPGTETQVCTFDPMSHVLHLMRH
jgi:hypothetical protein